MVVNQMWLIPLITQLLIWLPLRILFFYFGRLKVDNREAIAKLPSSFIIISNHTSYLDMFLVSHLFPFGARFFPIRYPTAVKHYFTWKRPFVLALGAYPILKGGTIEKILERSVKILKDRGRIMLFPEGKIHRLGRRMNPRRGTSYLAAKCKSYILPCYIEGFKPTQYRKGFSWKELLLRRYNLHVAFGEPFLLKDVYSQIPSTDEEYRAASEKLIERVYKLNSNKNK